MKVTKMRKNKNHSKFYFINLHIHLFNFVLSLLINGKFMFVFTLFGCEFIADSENSC